jgi:hypothetical protein
MPREAARPGGRKPHTANGVLSTNRPGIAFGIDLHSNDNITRTKPRNTAEDTAPSTRFNYRISSVF